MKNKIKQFTSYIKSIGGVNQENWGKYSFSIDTIYGIMRVSVHDSDFTGAGKPRSKFNNLVSIYSSFEDFDKALPFLKKMKHSGDMPVLNGKLNRHLSGGNSAEENWDSLFGRFKQDLEEILLTDLKINLWVDAEVYLPDAENDRNWFEYEVTLYNNNQVLDSWDSIDSYHSTGQKLNLENAEKSIEEIKKDVKNGLANRWFSHPILA